MEARTAYILTVGLAALLVAVLLWQRERKGKTTAVWLASAVIGVLLGMAGMFAFAWLAGYQLTRIPPPEEAVAEDAGDEGGGGMRQAGGGGPGGRRGSGRGPSPRRDLVSTVRKLDLLTGGVVVTLDGDQAAGLIEVLDGIESGETMTDDEAKAKQEGLLALLTDDQKARLEAVGLPRSSFGRGGGPSRSGEGGGESPDANPFKQETSADAVVRLRGRFSQDK